MAYRVLGLDRVLESAAAPGTGAVSPGGAVAGFRTFASLSLSAGDTFPYYVEAVDAQGLPTGSWERGFGTWPGGGTVARTVILGSSDAGAAVNFTTAVRVGIAPMTETTDPGLAPGGRLSVSATDPTADAAGVSTLYYVPYAHDRITLFDGAGLRHLPFVAPSLALSGLTADTGYDVFARVASGAVALDHVAWGSATVRAQALAYANGFRCLGSDPTRRYLGSFYAQTAAETGDHAGGWGSQIGANRHLWNAYNRRPRAMVLHDLTATWTYSGAAWRSWGGVSSPLGLCRFFVGLVEDVVVATQVSSVYHGAAGTAYYSGIGHNQANNVPPQYFGRHVSIAAGETTNGTALFRARPTLGYNYLTNVESCGAGSAIVVGQQTNFSGLAGTVWA